MKKSIRSSRLMAVLLVAVLPLAGVAGYLYLKPVLPGEAPPPPRPASVAAPLPSVRVFPYSIVPGGVRSRERVRQVIREDRVAALHYVDLTPERLRPVRAERERAFYVSYRINDEVYWTRAQHTIPAGELLLTDGVNLVRARCGNRLSEHARVPVRVNEPTEAMMEPMDSRDVILPEVVRPGLSDAEDLAWGAPRKPQLVAQFPLEMPAVPGAVMFASLEGHAGRGGLGGYGGGGGTVAYLGTRASGGSAASEPITKEPVVVAPVVKPPVVTPAPGTPTKPAAGTPPESPAEPPDSPKPPSTPEAPDSPKPPETPEPPVNPPVYPPVNPPVYPPVNPPVYPPVKPPVNPPVNPPVYPPVYPPVNPPVDPPVPPPNPPEPPPLPPPLTPAPEPGTVVLMSVGLGLVALRARRLARRKSEGRSEAA